MNESVKISVIVPVYNVEKYLKKCLDSILAQTLCEIEIICINDGSTDSSLDILEKYHRKDSRIKVISKENSGYGNTMNTGMDAAVGKYIGIVESDDYVAPDMFERLYETAEIFQAEVVKSDHYIFRTWDNREHKTLQNVCPEEYYNRALNAQICPEIFNFTMMNWTGIYSKDFLKKNNVRHNETPGASFQDNGFWFQVIALVNRIVFINEAFYYYRQDNPESSIHNKEKVFCICDEFRYIRTFLDNQYKEGKDYYKYFFEKKFFNYFHTYHRIESKYRMIFLYRIAEEFSKDMENARFVAESIDPWVYAQVNRIIDSPELFCMEDSMVRYQEEYSRVHANLMKIRNSEEFRKGLRIKKMLHM